MKIEVKNLMPLTNLEFNILKQLIQLEQICKLKNTRILLNLQISGGKDSMCLFHTLTNILFSKLKKLNNEYILVVQHFNHKQRQIESEEDCFFVAQSALQKGIPVYINCLKQIEITNNFQEKFRNWRKIEAKKLCENLVKEFNCEKYFIVTAHHARDNVETILQHILRGTGIQGLKGLKILDENNIYFRPFFSTKYNSILAYVKENNVKFREDSSNAKEKYSRNYIRKNILPHFEYLQPDYENSFLKLSEHININTVEISKNILVDKHTNSAELYLKIKTIYNLKDISENCINNILHECKLLLKKKSLDLIKHIELKNKQKLRLEKKLDYIELVIQY